MPNYPTHSRWGRVGAVVAAVLVGAAIYVLFGTPTLAIAGAVGAAATTFVGAIFPDVDHHRSIPRRKANTALRILVALGVVSVVALRFEGLVSMTETASTEFDVAQPVPPEIIVGISTAVGAVVLGWLVDPVIGLATHEHRAWTHNVLVMLVVTVLIGVAVWAVTRGATVERQVAALSVVSTFFFGVLIHLGLDDEIVG
ncbi:MAG: metal-dependent hydrolase [Halovenus sp.]